MSLDAPVLKFNNIYTFSTRFQKCINSFNNPYSSKFIKLKDIPILNTISSNINASLDIIRSRNEFNPNFSNTNSTLTFDNYSLNRVIEVYSDVVEKLTKPIDSILYLFNNRTNNIPPSNETKLISDFLNEIREPNDPEQVIDLYIREYMNVPKATNNVINFIYFIRRFPLLRLLINHYLMKHKPNTFNLIRLHRLDNITYLLYKEEGERPNGFNTLFKTGLFDFESDYDLTDSNQSPPLEIEDEYENVFMNRCNGCKRSEFKKYNTLRAIQNVNKIESIIYLFPFLYDIDDLVLFSNQLKSIILRIQNRKNGVLQVNTDWVITDSNDIFLTVLNDMNELININDTIQIGAIRKGDIFSQRIMILFAYDLIINQIDMINVYPKLTLEDILIKFSTFLLNTYGVFKHSGIEEDSLETFYQSIEFNPLETERRRTIPNPPNEDINILTFNEDQNPILLPRMIQYVQTNEKRFYSYFYLFAAQLIFSNPSFRLTVESDLFKMSHLFYVFNYFHHDVKELNPLFIFSAFSDGRNKWIKNYKYEKNYFLNWANEYFDSLFPEVNKFVIN